MRPARRYLLPVVTLVPLMLTACSRPSDPLITPEEGRKVLEKAKAAKAVYAPPGAKTPAGVR